MRVCVFLSFLVLGVCVFFAINCMLLISLTHSLPIDQGKRKSSEEYNIMTI